MVQLRPVWGGDSDADHHALENRADAVSSEVTIVTNSRLYCGSHNTAIEQSIELGICPSDWIQVILDGDVTSVTSDHDLGATPVRLRGD